MMIPPAADRTFLKVLIHCDTLSIPAFANSIYCALIATNPIVFVLILIAATRRFTCLSPNSRFNFTRFVLFQYQIPPHPLVQPRHKYAQHKAEKHQRKFYMTAIMLTQWNIAERQDNGSIAFIHIPTLSLSLGPLTRIFIL